MGRAGAMYGERWPYLARSDSILLGNTLDEAPVPRLALTVDKELFFSLAPRMHAIHSRTDCPVCAVANTGH